MHGAVAERRNGAKKIQQIIATEDTGFTEVKRYPAPESRNSSRDAGPAENYMTQHTEILAE
jgi:hypothetical protein